MRLLRTPDARFENLDGYDFAPHFVEIHDDCGSALRVHYLDEGPRDAPTVLLLHGEPTWAYLYRGLIPRLSAAGLRVIAPDLIGFGRSDKPSEFSDHTYQRHVEWMKSFVGALGLSAVRFALHDWGGLIGLRVLAESPRLANRVLLSNTTLPLGERGPPRKFLEFRERLRDGTWITAADIIQSVSPRALPAVVRRAYDAPFPDPTFTAGVRALPNLLPISTDDPESRPNRAAWQVLEHFERPLLTIFSAEDPLTFGAEQPFIRRVPGARAEAHRVLAGAGHFIQEDAADEYAALAVEFLARAD